MHSKMSFFLALQADVDHFAPLCQMCLPAGCRQAFPAEVVTAVHVSLRDPILKLIEHSTGESVALFVADTSWWGLRCMHFAPGDILLEAVYVSTAKYGAMQVMRQPYRSLETAADDCLPPMA